jgi:hypothetical protein
VPSIGNLAKQIEIHDFEYMLNTHIEDGFVLAFW